MNINKELLINDLKKIPRQLLGYLIIASGLSIIKAMNLGMNPWGTLQLGISQLTGISFGTAQQLVGLFIIVVSCFMKMYPGIGTITNMFCIGFFLNIIDNLHIIFAPDFILFKLLLILLGQVIFSYGVYLYISCGIGAGPRDGLMVGLVKITGKSVAVVKTSIECCVFIVGFLLGGTVGIGTVVATFLGGWILNKVFELNNYNPNIEKQSIFIDYIVKK